MWINEIKERAEKAAPWPWCCGDVNIDIGYMGDEYKPATQADKLFINHAREDVPYLLARLDNVERAARELLPVLMEYTQVRGLDRRDALDTRLNDMYTQLRDVLAEKKEKP